MSNPKSTPAGKVTIFRKSTGERVERWPVDARELLATGEFVASLDGKSELKVDPAPGLKLKEGAAEGTGGYRVEQTSATWWKCFGPDGKQVGNAQRSEADAQALIPVTHQPGGEAPAGASEHSPGVPLKVDAEGSEARPLTLED